MKNKTKKKKKLKKFKIFSKKITNLILVILTKNNNYGNCKDQKIWRPKPT